MRRRVCIALLAVGLVILTGGLLYDLYFVNTPAPGSAPELQAQFEQHSRIARAIEAVGLTIWAFGVIDAVLLFMHAKLTSRPDRKRAADTGATQTSGP